MVEPTPTDLGGPAVRRRTLFRGGMMLAGAAGAAAVASAINPATAHAADGDPVRLAQTNTSTGNTILTVNDTAGGVNPAVRLRNTTGPALQLDPLPASFDGDLGVGQLAATPYGPLVGPGSPAAPGHRSTPPGDYGPVHGSTSPSTPPTTGSCSTPLSSTSPPARRP